MSMGKLESLAGFSPPLCPVYCCELAVDESDVLMLRMRSECLAQDSGSETKRPGQQWARQALVTLLILSCLDEREG